jgi:ELWxxDGT repeat protein
LDDLLFADSGYVTFNDGRGFPNIGRAWLISGRPGGAAPNSLQMAIDSELILQDFSFGGSVAALGDVNKDGYNDFAVGSIQESRREEQTNINREGGLFVFYGGADLGGGVLTGDTANLVIKRTLGDDLPPDTTVKGILHAMAGDFDGDRNLDLAIGEPSRMVVSTGGSQQTLDEDTRGALYVFYNLRERLGELALDDADSILRGEFEFDGLGVLPATPAFDLDGDRLDDIVVGAGGADVIHRDIIPDGGKTYFIYGRSSQAALPPTAVELGTRSFTGSGFFLVDEGTGRPSVFQDAPGEDDPDFALQNGDDRWYTFTTLGDGEPGNVIRVVPGSFDGFVAPVDPNAASVTANPPTIVGNTLAQRDAFDSSRGGVFAGPELTSFGRLTSWSIFSGNFTDSADLADDQYVTPLILEQQAGGSFQITGIGTARRIRPNAPNEFPFQLVDGSDSIGPAARLGWYDGSAELGDNAGSVSYSTFPFFEDTFHKVDWLGPGHGAAQNVAAGNSLRSLQTFERSYAVQAKVTAGAVLEFDLGRFLGWAGDPQALASAELILQAPDAAAPVQAPTEVSDIVHAAGKTYFTAWTASLGYELWVTEGTEATTRLVRDLNPGPSSSFPSNLTNVGGSLYFTANEGISGAQLWKSDGTTTTLIGTIAGSPFDFTPQLGAASLLAEGPAPLDGVPDVDLVFMVEALHVDGSTTSLSVTVTRDQFADNGSLAELLTDVQTAVATAGGGETISLGLSGGRFTVTAVDSSVARVTVRDGESLGFAADQATPQAVSLEAAAVPPAPNPGADVAFTLEVRTIGGGVTPIPLLLTSAVTQDNSTVAALAGDLQALLPSALASVGFAPGAVSVSASEPAGRILLSVTDPTIADVRVLGGTLFGFTDDQTSIGTVSMTAATDGPDSGMPPSDLNMTLDVVLADGRTLELEVALPGGMTAGNEGLGDLASQLQKAINDGLSQNGGGAVSVRIESVNDAPRLSIVATDGSIAQMAIRGAEVIGFGTDQASQRSGDRLYFVSSDFSTTTRLWKLEAETLTAFDLPSVSTFDFTKDLTSIGSTLYFTAFDGGVNRLWRAVDGGGPEVMPGQDFVNPYGLIDADGMLAFAATPSGDDDAQVFSFDGEGFTQLTNIEAPDSDVLPFDLAVFNGEIYFVAQDHLSGPYLGGSGFVGREVWAVRPGVPDSVRVVANLGQIDFDPIEFVFGLLPGQVVSSDPFNLSAGEAGLYFSGFTTDVGYELRLFDGAQTSLVHDAAAGPDSSFPFDVTHVGSQTYFAANGQLWVTDGTDTRALNFGGEFPFALTPAGGLLYFSASGLLWVTDGTDRGTRAIRNIVPPKVPLEVYVLRGEGNHLASFEDTFAPALPPVRAAIGAEPIRVDITQAVRDALARGDTRLTLRIETPDGDQPLTFSLAGTARDGQTGLQLNSTVPSLVADLLSGDGSVIETGKSTIDLRVIESGTYFLRVYDPLGRADGDVPFVIEASPPKQGYTHPIPDRDEIRGGDGDDLITGNQGLDRIWGDSGSDDFIAELLEVRDLDAPPEDRKEVLPEERSTIPPEGPPVDAYVAIEDSGLRVAIAEALGLPVTPSYIPGQFVIHVPDASARTDLPLTDSNVHSQRILASDLAEIVVLDAARRGVATLTGLQYAINVETLNLAGNFISNGELDGLVPAEQSSGETRGFPIGLPELENLLLDFNFVDDLTPLEQLTALRRLSYDSFIAGDLIHQVADLTWPVVGGGERGLEFLSLDSRIFEGRGLSSLVSDLTPLASQTDLRYLSLKNNAITDVRPLVHLSQLEVLRLDGNDIRNIEDLAGIRLIDDGDAGFETIGPWQSSLQPTSTSFEDDYQFHFGADEAAQPVWRFTNLDPGEYEVLLTWPADPSRSSDVTVVVKGADTAAIVGGLSLFDSVDPQPTESPIGGQTVTIDTDALTIVGDDEIAEAFYGTAFTTSVTKDGKAQFVVLGDLVIPGDTIEIVGSRPLSLVVGNNVVIHPGAVFNAAGLFDRKGTGGFWCVFF